VFAALCGAVLTLSPAAPARDPVTPPSDFTAIGTVTKFGLVGDVYRVREVIKIGGNRVGTARMKLTLDGKRAHLAGKWRLDDGTIEVKGRAERVRGATEAPIVDGTRAFQDVTGTIRLNSISRRKSREKFDFK
jgi:hypothetical protein